MDQVRRGPGTSSMARLGQHGIWGAGEIVRSHRERIGYTRPRLAQVTGLERSTIRRIENGQRGIGERSLRRLSAVLGTAFVRDMEAFES